MFDIHYNIHKATVEIFLEALWKNDVEKMREILTQAKEIDPLDGLQKTDVVKVKAVEALLRIPCGEIRIIKGENKYEKSKKYLRPKEIKDYSIEDYRDKPNRWGNPEHDKLLPLHFAAAHLQLEMIDLFLSFGADPNQYRKYFHKDEFWSGWHATAIMYSVLEFAWGNLSGEADTKICRDVTKRLIAAGADTPKDRFFAMAVDLFLSGEDTTKRYYKEDSWHILDVMQDFHRCSSERTFLTGAYQEIKAKNRDVAKRLPPMEIKGKPNTEFLDFCHVLRFAHKIECAQQGVPHRDLYEPIGPMGIRLLHNTEGSWSKISERLENFTINDAINTRDAVREFTIPIALPELLRKTKKQIRAGAVDVAAALQLLQEKTAEILMGDRSLFTILDLQRDWHRHLPILESIIRKSEFPRGGEWLPLTADYTDTNGMILSFVTDTKTLEELSKLEQLNNCLYLYPSSCVMGQAHVGIVKKDGKTISAFELSADYGRKKVRKAQHEAASRAAPDPQAEAALQNLITGINKGDIKVEFNAIRNAASGGMDTQGLPVLCGFDPFARDAKRRQTIALQAYLEIKTGGRKESVVRGSHPFVPGGKEKWENIGATKFLKQTGLMDFIVELAANMPLKTREDYRGRHG